MAKTTAVDANGLRKFGMLDKVSYACLLYTSKAFGAPAQQIEGLLDLANGHLFRGLKNVLK